MRTSTRASRSAATTSTGVSVGLLDGLAVVLAETVEGVAALDGDAGRRHVGDLDGVVLAGADGLGEVVADLLAVDVERGDELDVADVVLAELDVHEARGHGSPGRRRGSTRLPGPGTRRSCRRRRWRRVRNPSGALLVSRAAVLLTVWSACGVHVRGAGGADDRAAVRSCRGCGGVSTLGLDELGQPAHLALDRLEPVPVQLEGVAVDAARGCGPAWSATRSRFSSSRMRRPSRMRRRTSASVWAKNAKCTPKFSSSHAEGPASPSSSAKRSLPSAVSV